MQDQYSILKQYIENPNWNEVMKLYSGLFQEMNDSNNFIIKLSSDNVLLASECLNSYIYKNKKVEDELIVKLLQNKRNSKENVLSTIELKRFDLLTPSTFTLKIILNSVNVIDSIDAVSACYQWISIKIKMVRILHKKDLRLINLILENKSVMNNNYNLIQLLDLIFVNTSRSIIYPQVLGVDVISWSYSLFEKFNYRINEYANLVIPFLREKKSNKKTTLINRLSNQLSSNIK